MSDVSQGPGWWQASDGKWYSPEQRPAVQATAPQAPIATAAGAYPSGSPPGPLAHWGTRVVATLIDSAALLALVIVGGTVAAIASAISSAVGTLLGAVVYLVFLGVSFYFTYMTGACGQSPGKKVMGIKVVSEKTGQVIGGGLGIVRGLAHFVDVLIFYVGFLFPLWDWKRQTLADKIMNTIVLSNVPKQRLSIELLKVK